jgi:hypothetical protein
METTKGVIKSEDYGLEESKANELTVGLNVVKAERKLLEQEFEEVSKLELITENLPKFRELRIKIRDNRTKGINKWHTANKAFFLTGGKFIDATKNKESSINELMESKLLDAENHFKDLEKKRVELLNIKRVDLVRPYLEDVANLSLADMDDDVFEAYLTAKRNAYTANLKAIKKLEEERLEAIEKKNLEDEEIRIENARLRQEADKSRAIIKAKEDAENKVIVEANNKLQKDLNKGDADKVNDLIRDFQLIKSAYSFKSDENKKMYTSVCILIDKVIKHINS